MKIRAQIAMVLNLDKCIGCHTCSVTCKNVWTSRQGMEYAWFNNVETKPGMTMMYHAQEKIINTPGSEITGQRGGIHNSVTRIVTKPTHMIGGYAQLSYGFNYYGTIGTKRDEFVVVRKMNKVDWLDTPIAEQLIKPTLEQGETA